MKISRIKVLKSRNYSQKIKLKREVRRKVSIQIDKLIFGLEEEVTIPSE